VGNFIAVIALGNSFQTGQTRSKYNFLLERLSHSSWPCTPGCANPFLPQASELGVEDVKRR
jgi:hypothetical protein